MSHAAEHRGGATGKRRRGYERGHDISRVLLANLRSHGDFAPFSWQGG
jgi:hypothetical protein